MTEQKDRRKITRRAHDFVVLERLQEQIDEMHSKLFNGLGQDLRQEMKQEISGVRNLFFGLLISLVLALAGIIVEGRVSANQATSENNRNYQAILEIGSKLENHIIRTTDE